jgi:hypothetical protein
MDGRKTGGRKEGVPNKITQEQREAFKLLLDGNMSKLQKWIDTTAKVDPARAFSMVMDLAAHCVPKMKSIEITEPTPVLPVLVVRDGMAFIPDDYPGPAVRINSPEYHAEHPPQGHVVHFIDPASGTDRQQDVLVFPRKDGREPHAIMDWDGIEDEEPTEAPPATPAPPPTATAPPAPPPPPPSRPRTMADVIRRRNSW